MAEIRVEKLHKAFGEFVAVRESDFTVADGEFFVMLGPSGCGKTTTLRMIAGLELPTSGRILLGGEDVTFNRAAARDIAFVFQLFALYPHMNVRQNIGFPLKCEGMPRAEIRQPRRGDRALPADRSSPQRADLAACRRRPPARRPRPRHRPPAQGLPDGRAARHPRHRIPRPDGARTPRTPHADRRDHGLRHPRPARSDVDGRQDRGDEQGRHRAIRHAAGDLRPPRHHVRRRLHRLAADELPDLPRQPGARARASVGVNGAEIAIPTPREARGRDRPRPRRPARACPLRRRLEAARHRLRHRISRHHPDRHRQHRPRPGQGAPVGRYQGRNRRDRRAGAPLRTTVALRRVVAAGRSARRSTREWPMAEVVLSGADQAVQDGRGRRPSRPDDP